jgi:ABC-type lipoprotein release transport system permease subunit
MITTFLASRLFRRGLAVLGIAVILILARLILGGVPFSYSYRNLIVRWKTTVLTALAFTLVVSLLVIMLAFVNGMSRLTEASGHPENVVVLSEGATDESFSYLVPTDTSDVERSPGVLACSREVYIIANQPLPNPSGGPERRRFVQVRGIEDPQTAERVHDLELLPGGQWFSQAGVEQLASAGGGKAETAIQAVLGEGVARELGHDAGKERLVVGDVFELGPRKWKVVGLMKSEGSTFGSEVWAKGSYLAELYGKPNYSSIVLKTSGADSARAVADDLTKNYKKANLQAFPEPEYYSKLSATNKQFLGGIIFVTVIMAIGGMFGVMNTMFAAISQRTKDIGVLRIVGFRRWQVLVTFFLESLAIALVGGLVGCALGFLVNGWTATSIISGGQGGFGKTVVLRLAVDLNTLATGLLVALVMGALGGLLPALGAMRLRPLESLR